MTMNFKSKYRQYLKIRIGLFLMLFVFRLAYGYLETDSSNVFENSDNFFSRIENLRKNYASEKMSKGDALPSQNPSNNLASNQKYEKTASIKSKTSNFDEDKTKLEKTTKDFKAVVQYEKNEGKKGNREIHLLIGVNPILFDSFYTNIQKIGALKATEITKIDKTNDRGYRRQAACKSKNDRHNTQSRPAQIEKVHAKHTTEKG